MYSDKVIVDIGGNADDRYGYSYRSKELFIKSNKKMTGMSIIPVLIISGAFPASAMNFVENHSLEISPVEWLVLTTVACLLLSFVVAIILLFLSEKCIYLACSSCKVLVAWSQTSVGPKY